MITSIANNIGIPQVSFKSYESSTLTVLTGRFNIDLAAREYQAADVIEFKFQDMVMKKSAETYVWLMASGVTPNRGTILRSWLKDNSLFIERVSAFDNRGPLTIIVCSAYAMPGQRLPVEKGIIRTPLPYGMPDGVQYNSAYGYNSEHYVFLCVRFSRFYANDGSLDIEFGLADTFDDVEAYVPLIYPESSSHANGAPMTLGHIANATFSCTNVNDVGCTKNSGQFFIAFIARQ